jgi:large subunit ribosomal protein L4
MMVKYNLNTLNVKTGKSKSTSFDSVEIDENLSGNVYLIHNNQKKDRIVYSFTKNRNDFTSGGAKPFRQKGTGRARMGTTRSPLKVGGAVTFGPKPRVVRRKSNRKFFLSTLRQLLLSKITNSVLLDSHDNVDKVKDFTPQINIEKTYLIVLDITDSKDLHFFTRVKNIPNLYFNNVNSIIVEDVLRADEIIYTASSFQQLFTESEAE